MMHAEGEWSSLLLGSAMQLEDAVARKVKRSVELQMVGYGKHRELTCDCMRELGW